jgi:hypothetical protein
MGIVVKTCDLTLSRLYHPGVITLCCDILVGGLTYAACFRVLGAGEMRLFLSAMPRKIQRLATGVFGLAGAEGSVS